MRIKPTKHRKRVRHINEPSHAHELTFSCHRRFRLLNRDRSRQWFVDALAQARNKWDLEIWAYVIMPEHAHVLLFPRNEHYEIGAILKTIKQSVSRRAMRYLREHSPQYLERLEVEWPTGRVEYRFWLQGGGYDRNIVEPSTAWRVVRYIHENPVRRGLVENVVDWPWSSARWYEGSNGIVLPMNGHPPEPIPEWAK